MDITQQLQKLTDLYLNGAMVGEAWEEGQYFLSGYFSGKIAAGTIFIVVAIVRWAVYF